MFWIFQAYFWWIVASLAWTADLAVGRSMVSRHVVFLLAGVYFTVAQPEHRRRYLVAFSAGVLACELLAGYNWLQLNAFTHWPAGLRAAKDAMETAPFVDRILFGPIVAFAGYVAGWRALVETRPARIGWALAWLACVLELCISGSRTGMLGFSVMMALLTLQTLRRHRLLAVGAAAAVLVASTVGLYAFSDKATRQRVADGFAELRDPDGAINQSLPLRIRMADNTVHLIAEQPWLGVGAGDFGSAYQAINARRSPGWDTPRNPHNQLLFTVATTGVVGGVLLLGAWFGPPWWYRHRADGWAALGVALPVFYFTISLAESYIWRTNTGLMFVLFSALLYGRPPPQR